MEPAGASRRSSRRAGKSLGTSARKRDRANPPGRGWAPRRRRRRRRPGGAGLRGQAAPARAVHRSALAPPSGLLTDGLPATRANPPSRVGGFSLDVYPFIHRRPRVRVLSPFAVSPVTSSRVQKEPAAGGVRG